MAMGTHPATAQIYGIEVWRGRPFLVVEFLPGGTLKDRIQQGPVPPPEAVVVVARLADALATLHDKGLLHGDIKPGNVGFTSNGSPKLLDFGLARETDDAATAGGTLRYLSPEVLSGRLADEADDVWSLCVVLYEMVSGRHPFAAAAIEEEVDRIRRRRVFSAAGPKGRSAVIRFAASILTAPRSKRPQNARIRRSAKGSSAERINLIFRGGPVRLSFPRRHERGRSTSCQRRASPIAGDLATAPASNGSLTGTRASGG